MNRSPAGPSREVQEKSSPEPRSRRKNFKAPTSGTCKDAFVWSDDEVELLLSCVNDYKTEMAASGVDWETVRLIKYVVIRETFLKCIEAAKKDGSTSPRDYKHGEDDLTKEIVASKLKNIRAKYREAVDSGRRNGHGRVVLLFFEHCEAIWGGSPATEEISCGIETGDNTVDLTESQDAPVDVDEHQESDCDAADDGASTSMASLNGDEGSNTAADTDRDTGSAPHAEPQAIDRSSLKRRRELLDEKLDNYRDEKLKKKIPMEASFGISAGGHGSETKVYGQAWRDWQDGEEDDGKAHRFDGTNSECN